MNLSILYRGPLSSCNYACGYCPFAKRRASGRASPFLSCDPSQTCGCG